ncbi:solute carrier family 25 member 35 [Patella vulgata]|uniref:solute carrier family 25 member 35 n=1 Tax=Patella vulgata TaxID=6465 RepID=UPI00218030F8|nr:solute carrier family 25 member 35 [Patella vulgata]
MVQKFDIMEFVLGGIATCGAGLFTNPLEVVKTRMQLQGELKSRGQYAVHYRNAMHAFYTVAKTDGLLALQNGLVPALWYQFFMNGFRLGTYQILVNLDFTKDSHGNISALRSVLAGAFAGCVGAFVGSPFFMVKTQLQSQAAQSIAVGHQHLHESMTQGLRKIYSEFGILGLWRGVSAAIPRVTVGSGAQLATFSTTKQFLIDTQMFKKDSLLIAFIASMGSGVAVTLFMTPFDVVSTRLYNQGIDAAGKGLLYKNVLDCFIKIFKKEGLWGFYKGWGASYFRLGPHTVLSLVFWDKAREMYNKLNNKTRNIEIKS